MRALGFLSINEKSIFPGLDGSGWHLNNIKTILIIFANSFGIFEMLLNIGKERHISKKDSI